ncbi:MAG: hypothetical protein HY922_11825 [Elusimicrobia bacterium]|nr:hypothetical protein [Elusimicrobiota bacterium]
MPRRRIETVLKTDDGQSILLRGARPEDMRRIQVLYAEVYGASYPMSLITDKQKMRRAIESDRYYWLIAESRGQDRRGRIVASLIYELDQAQRISKALGAVVSKEFRKQNLAQTMMAAVLKEITRGPGAADTVYATTRTVTTAPQRLTDTLGFAHLGIFPNAHKVFEHETHCLAAYFQPSALRMRKTPPLLIKEIAPLYKLVCRELAIGRAVYQEPPPARKPYGEQPLLSFESIPAPSFVKRRFKRVRAPGVFSTSFVPFHEPNLLLITPDQKTEVFIHYGAMDRYSVILGGRTKLKDFALILKSVTKALNDMGVSYIELIVDAYSPRLQRQALEARFLPSAYYPAFRKVGNRRWDYIIFSRSFEMLDFRNVRVISAYRGFLKEYLRIWQALFIDMAFKNA